MGFIKLIDKFETFDFDNYFQNVTDDDVIKSLNKENHNEYDFLNLLSDKASNHLEQMAKKSHQLTVQNFGKTIQLYIPLYISNYCSNICVYCGFNKNNKIVRKHLTFDEIEKEASQIALTGIQHILILTGEAEDLVTLEYLTKSISIIKKHFSSVSIEIYPMDQDQYEILKNTGVDGLTIYQETYDREIYKQVHLKGKKTDYLYRLATPERAAKVGIRSVNIGTLFGLGDIKKEAFLSGLHAKYLSDKYINTEFGISLPRINSSEIGFKPLNILDDKKFVQFITAYRIYMPKVAINISTREREGFRDKLLPLGITKISAGSKTTVGGYSNENDSSEQFAISDNRSVIEISEMLKQNGYQAIYKDWEQIV